MQGIGFQNTAYGTQPMQMSARPGGTMGYEKIGVPYPNPFFDAAQTYFPSRLKQMLRWCRYFFFTNPLINAVVYKLAEYPITPIVYDTKEKKVQERYRHLFEDQLQIRKFQIEVGLDYYNFGNAFVSVHFPFVKFLECRGCGHEAPAKDLRPHYRFSDLKFMLRCPKCGHHAAARVRDETLRSPKGIRLIRWDPERVEIEHNEGLTEPVYYYKIPRRLKNRIRVGRKRVVEQVSDTFFQAMRKNKAVVFAQNRLFHLKRPIIAQKDQGWGMPLVLPVLKDIFYLQILRKGQEMIAQEHIVPLRVLFPQPGGESSDPHTMVNLSRWRENIEEEVARWRADPNYIPIMPIPLGHEMIGGQGRALVLHQELRVWSEQIIAGMNVPLEFIFGGMQYTGSNVSMRILENQFIGYRSDQRRMVRDFIMGRICDHLGWPKVNIRFERFKMADDLQRLMIYFQANQAMKLSDTTFLRELGEDLAVEEERKQSELNRQIEANRHMMVAQAAAQGEANLASMRYDLQGQKLQNEVLGPPPDAMGMPPEGGDPAAAGAPMEGAPEEAGLYAENAGAAPEYGMPPAAAAAGASQEGGMDIRYVAQRVAAQLRSAQESDPALYAQYLQRIKMGSPQLYQLVQAYLQQTGGERSPLNPMQRPIPEVKPPRAEPGRALV